MRGLKYLSGGKQTSLFCHKVCDKEKCLITRMFVPSLMLGSTVSTQKICMASNTCQGLNELAYFATNYVTKKKYFITRMFVPNLMLGSTVSTQKICAA
jgi:hypothetical protein